MVESKAQNPIIWTDGVPASTDNKTVKKVTAEFSSTDRLLRDPLPVPCNDSRQVHRMLQNKVLNQASKVFPYTAPCHVLLTDGV